MRVISNEKKLSMRLCYGKCGRVLNVETQLLPQEKPSTHVSSNDNKGGIRNVRILHFLQIVSFLFLCEKGIDQCMGRIQILEKRMTQSAAELTHFIYTYNFSAAVGRLPFRWIAKGVISNVEQYNEPIQKLYTCIWLSSCYFFCFWSATKFGHIKFRVSNMDIMRICCQADMPSNIWTQLTQII